MSTRKIKFYCVYSQKAESRKQKAESRLKSESPVRMRTGFASGLHVAVRRVRKR